MLERFRRRRASAPEPQHGAERDLEAATSSVADRAIIERALPFTMTGRPRLQALIDAVRYCVRRDVPGAFVECGVWRGGSVLAMLLVLGELGIHDRDIVLFDTFAGMTAPTDLDTSPFDPPAAETWDLAAAAGQRPWPGVFGAEVFNEDDVRRTVLAAGYPSARIHFVKGPVEETLPQHAPDSIALLRLDTDWYASTAAEMAHLYPRLSAGGVLIVDDYGHWDGARRAVDEHFDRHGDAPLLSRIDYTARIGVKP